MSRVDVTMGEESPVKDSTEKEVEQHLLDVRSLSVEIPAGKRTVYPADSVSFSLSEGEILALVGESGSGKSVTMKAIMGLLPKGTKVEAEQIVFRGRSLKNLTEKEYCKVRGKEISMIFQDPMTALNPLLRIGEQITARKKRRIWQFVFFSLSGFRMRRRNSVFIPMNFPAECDKGF